MGGGDYDACAELAPWSICSHASEVEDEAFGARGVGELVVDLPAMLGMVMAGNGSNSLHT